MRREPWWEGSHFPAVSILEANFNTILNEFKTLIINQLKLHPQSKGGSRTNITNGDWKILDFFVSSSPNIENSKLMPKTYNILKDLDHPIGGLMYLSVIDPYVRVAPHAANIKTRIRIHLGLIIPEGAWIRVGSETRTWQEGKCLVFDDSFQHEIINNSNSVRVVLLVDAWHPDLTDKEKEILISIHKNTNYNREERKGWVRELQ